MRPVVYLTVAAVCMSLVGCSSLKGKSWNPFAGASRSPAKNKDDLIPPTEPAETAPLAMRSPGGAASGVLAGQVIDVFNQKRPGTVILVQATDAGPNEEPMEAEVNREGYFTIQGLTPGKRYKLVARSKKDDQVLGGTTLATPPNVQLVIRVSESLPAAELPPKKPGGKRPAASLPPYSADQAKGKDGAGAAGDGTPQYLHEPDRGVNDRIAPIPAPLPEGNRIAPPRSPADRAPGSPERLPPARPEYQTLDPKSMLAAPPRVTIPSPSVPGSAAPTTGVPSCTLIGNRVEDFALNDLNGQPFHVNELRGKLVLLDFWGTWCTACMQGIPHLTELQRRYGSRGLEIVGIAYEDGNLSEKIQRVNFVRNRQGINYRLLLGEGNDCPVLKKLGVHDFPTLILLDERGEIVWRGEGMSSQTKARLEAELRKRLQ